MRIQRSKDAPAAVKASGMEAAEERFHLARENRPEALRRCMPLIAIWTGVMAAFLAGGLLLSGCGGGRGASGGNQHRGTGRLVLTIEWPQGPTSGATRDIPADATHVQAILRAPDGTIVESKEDPREKDPLTQKPAPTQKVAFGNIVVGSYDLEVNALDKSGGNSQVLARARVPLVIEGDGKDANITISLSEIIDESKLRLVDGNLKEYLNNAELTLAAGKTLPLTFQVLNSSGGKIGSISGQITWSLEGNTDADKPNHISLDTNKGDKVTVTANRSTFGKPGTQAGQNSPVRLSATLTQNGQSVKVSVNVSVKPTVTLTAEKLSDINQGEPIKLTARLVGANKNEVTFIANIANKDGKDVTSLVIQNVKSDPVDPTKITADFNAPTAGTYAVRASIVETAGLVVSEPDILLKVKEAAIQVTPPSSDKDPVKVKAGGTVKLTATVTGVLDSRVNWTVDGDDKKGTKGTVAPAETNGNPNTAEYTAPNAAGTYKIIATSKVNSSLQGTVIVEVPTGKVDVTIE